MIFVTVGTQVPFDRLVRAVDQWAGEQGRTDVFAQIGETELVPEHIEAAASLGPDEFARRFEAADVVVAHAGMGTILGALESGKPLLVMPRRASLGEHRNEHQLATARRFAEKGLVHVAMDESELQEHLRRIDQLESLGRIGGRASEELIAALREFAK
jgi:exopolysaccharide biosynthesis glucuronosyltransferase PssE